MNYIVTNRRHQEFFTGSQEDCHLYIIEHDSDDPTVPIMFTLPDLPEVSYPCGTTAYYDDKTNTYYNRNGQRLRDPEEYNQYAEGYTPFGDE